MPDYYVEYFDMPDGKKVYIKDSDLTEEVNSLRQTVANKVDKVTGKGLSTNDYTNADKALVQQIPDKVDKVTGKGLSTNDYTNADKALVNQISTIQANLNDKVDKVAGKGLSTNDYTNADKALVQQISDKVDKVAGKGLSTNDFTNAEKFKLDRTRLEGRKFVFIGDSYADGYNPDGNTRSWVLRVATYLGLTEGTSYWTNHAGGAGFGRTDNLSFRNLLNTLVGSMTTAQKESITDIVVAGGYNDYGYVNETINAGIDSFKTLVNNNFPNADVWLISIGWGKSSSVRRGLYRAYDESYSRASHANHWKYRELYQQMHYNEYFSSDGIHPTEQGQYLIANCIAGFLMDSDISMITQWVDIVLNATTVIGQACRVNNSVIAVFQPFNLSVSARTIDVSTPVDIGMTLTNSYIMGSDIDRPFAWPCVVHTVDDYYYQAVLSISVRRVNNAPRLYATAKIVKRDGSDYIASQIDGFQFQGAMYCLPLDDA